MDPSDYTYNDRGGLTRRIGDGIAKIVAVDTF